MDSDLRRFYALMDDLRERNYETRRLDECRGRMNWPQRGVYFFFEDRERRGDGTPRVVRVGTHALKANSRITLWKRLRQHRGTDGGRNPGGGNHRGSIFRLHVGIALLRRDGDPDGVAATWGVGRSAPGEVRAREYQHERRVSAHIGAMPFLWVSVADEAGPDSDRRVIETGAIGLLSRRANPAADAPSEHWLGLYSNRPTIVESGLWNVNHIDGPEPGGWLDVLEQHVRQHRC